MIARQAGATRERSASDAGHAMGIVTLVRPLQPENAESPMLVTLLGIVTLVRPLQP